MKLFIQKFKGKYLYLRQVINRSNSKPLSDVCIASNSPAEQTMIDLKYFLNYCATNLNPKFIFRATDTILQLHTSAAYLVAPKTRRRAAQHHIFKERKIETGQYILSKIINVVMSPVAEVECRGAFLNGIEACPFQTKLEKLR